MILCPYVQDENNAQMKFPAYTALGKQSEGKMLQARSESRLQILRD